MLIELSPGKREGESCSDARAFHSSAISQSQASDRASRHAPCHAWPGAPPPLTIWNLSLLPMLSFESVRPLLKSLAIVTKALRHHSQNSNRTGNDLLLSTQPRSRVVRKLLRTTRPTRLQPLRQSLAVHAVGARSRVPPSPACAGSPHTRGPQRRNERQRRCRRAVELLATTAKGLAAN